SPSRGWSNGCGRRSDDEARHQHEKAHPVDGVRIGEEVRLDCEERQQAREADLEVAGRLQVAQLDADLAGEDDAAAGVAFAAGDAEGPAVGADPPAAAHRDEVRGLRKQERQEHVASYFLLVSRNRRVSTFITPMAISGRSLRMSRKSSRPILRITASSTAVTLAERGSESSTAISPKTSRTPRRTSSFWPLCTFTLPSTIR